MLKLKKNTIKSSVIKWVSKPFDTFKSWRWSGGDKKHYLILKLYKTSLKLSLLIELDNVMFFVNLWKYIFRYYLQMMKEK